MTTNVEGLKVGWEKVCLSPVLLIEKHSLFLEIQERYVSNDYLVEEFPIIEEAI